MHSAPPTQSADRHSRLKANPSAKVANKSSTTGGAEVEPAELAARILLVDDHPLFREGLSRIIEDAQEFRVTAHALSSQRALELLEHEKFDCVILDLNLGDSSGINLLKDIQSRWPELPVLVVSMHDEKLYAERALKAGARGYLMKTEPPERVLEALRRVLRGKVVVTQETASMLLQRINPRQTARDEAKGGIPGIEASLSDREFEIFQLIGAGYGVSSLSERLNISPKTIETHRMHIKRKLGLKNAQELLRYAVQWVGANSASSN